MLACAPREAAGCLFVLQIPEQKQLAVPKTEAAEGYYEEAEPYDTSINGTSRAGPRGLRVWWPTGCGCLW